MVAARLWDNSFMPSASVSHRSWLPWLLLVAGVALAGALGGAYVARALGPRPLELSSGTWLPESRELADFTLTDARGRAFGKPELGGRPTLMFFGFTSCPDVCPATLAQLAAVQRALPALHVVFVSIDPQRDTPDALRQYVRAFHPDLVAVTGTPEALQPLERSLSVASVRVPLPDGGYTFDHSAALYLLDARARWVAVFTPPFAADRLIADLRAALGRLG